jgi:hypothetical protein
LDPLLQLNWRRTKKGNSTEVKEGLPVGIFWTFPSILGADQQAANAVCDFLIDLMSVQRAVGKFGLFLSAEDREAWLERMEAFFKREGVDLETRSS